MYISTTHSAFYDRIKDDKKTIQFVKDAGFTAYDMALTEADLLWRDDYLEYAAEIRKFADGIGLPCNQTHAPHPPLLDASYPLWEVRVYGERNGFQCNSFEEFNAKIYPKFVRAIEFSGILGAKVCVVHPGNRHNAEENARFYLSLADVARKAGVKIGVENSYDWKKDEPTACAAACSNHQDYKAHLDLLPEDVFVACVDIGHAELAGLNTSAVQMIETLGKRVQALHVHDVDLVHDNHAIPFSLQVDYEPIIAALKKIGYAGDITLEANVWKNVPDELLLDAAKWMAAVAAYFKTKIEK